MATESAIFFAVTVEDLFVFSVEWNCEIQVVHSRYVTVNTNGLSQSDGRADIYALGVLLNIMLTA